jgi:hypothetical protein
VHFAYKLELPRGPGPAQVLFKIQAAGEMALSIKVRRGGGGALGSGQVGKDPGRMPGCPERWQCVPCRRHAAGNGAAPFAPASRQNPNNRPEGAPTAGPARAKFSAEQSEK